MKNDYLKWFVYDKEGKINLYGFKQMLKEVLNSDDLRQ